MHYTTFKINSVLQIRRGNRDNPGTTFHITSCRLSSIIRQSFSFQNNPKDLDPSNKMDLDLWGCLGRVKLVFIAKFHRTDLII